MLSDKAMGGAALVRGASPSQYLGKVIQDGAGGNDIVGTEESDIIYGNGGADYISDDGGNDQIYGGAGNDILDSGSGHDLLVGGAGNDELMDFAGNDTFIGGAGNDVIETGSGRDTIVFDAALNRRTNVDTLQDYNPRYDVMRLENAVFRTLTKTGVLSSAAFSQGTAAHDADDRVIYDPNSGMLYYDPDGSGAAAQIQFAILKKHLAMTAKEFVVF